MCKETALISYWEAWLVKFIEYNKMKIIIKEIVSITKTKPSVFSIKNVETGSQLFISLYDLWLILLLSIWRDTLILSFLVVMALKEKHYMVEKK